MATSLTNTYLEGYSQDLPDLTNCLDLESRRVVGTGSLGVVYRYHCYLNGGVPVAVKVIVLPVGSDTDGEDEFKRIIKRELGIWRRLSHLNIAQLLGTVYGGKFASSYDCIVTTWMENGTLFEYVERNGTALSSLDRIKLIRGSAAGLKYLHSQIIVHGNLHPGNILIDEEHNPRLTDFGLSLPLSRIQYQSYYLWVDSFRPRGLMWAPPELLYPDFYPKPKLQAPLYGDIYSFGSIIFFILSGRCPWEDQGEAENKLKTFQNPSRPRWPVNIPDNVWKFLEQCWSPRDPGNRPSAREVLSFSVERLESSLRPNPASDINVVLFGPLGSGKSSIINLLAETEIAQTSPDVRPCTKRPTWYRISINEREFRFWDTMGFFPAQEGSTSHLLPYEQAHTVLRNLPEGVNLILLCAHKGPISPSLRRVYWLINDFFYGSNAPIALVFTHFDTPDTEWWERNKHDIAERTRIPTQFIPRACVTTLKTGCDESKDALKVLLHSYATVVPTLLRLDLRSSATASNLVAHCKLSNSDTMVLLESFSRPQRSSDIVLCGETGAMNTIISLLTGQSVVEIDPPNAAVPPSYTINTGSRQFRVWSVMGADKALTTSDVYVRAFHLIQGLTGECGIGLLVFCKRFGRLTSGELNDYGLIHKTLCKEKCPVAVVATHCESPSSVEEWWGTSRRDLFKSTGVDAIGHSCIAPLANHEPDGSKPVKALVDSRLSIEAMLEDCLSSQTAKFPRRKVEVILASLPLKKIIWRCTRCHRK